jgi:phage-related protein
MAALYSLINHYRKAVSACFQKKVLISRAKIQTARSAVITVSFITLKYIDKIMENLLNNLVNSAKEAVSGAAETLSAVKDAAAEKLSEVSAAASEMAAKAQAELSEEMAEKAADLAAAKENIANHEGGAMGFISDKAKELMGEVKEEIAEAADSGKNLWDKAKDYISGDKA